MGSSILKTLVVCLVVTTSVLPSAQQHSLKLSTISASPAVLPFPEAPSLSPSPGLSPDISPLFPTPAGSTKATPSPIESSLPIIPSSPSPPNPDSSSPEPDTALSPTTASSLPQSSATVINPYRSSILALLLSLVVHLPPHLIAFF